MHCRVYDSALGQSSDQLHSARSEHVDQLATEMTTTYLIEAWICPASDASLTFGSCFAVFQIITRRPPCLAALSAPRRYPEPSPNLTAQLRYLVKRSPLQLRSDAACARVAVREERSREVQGRQELPGCHSTGVLRPGTLTLP